MIKQGSPIEDSSRQLAGKILALGLFIGISGFTLPPSTANAAVNSPSPHSQTQAGSLLALSEIQKEELPALSPAPGQDESTPAPEPEAQGTGKEGASPETPAGQDGTATRSNDPARPHVMENDAPPPEVQYDLTKLPVPVQKMRELIIEAAKSGSLEALRPLIGTGDNTTMLSLGDYEGDPIEYLRGLAGDEEGQEVLAILIDLLDSGFVHMDAGTLNELYVWPYFFAYPLEKLDARQKVQLFQIITAGDYEDMKSFGAYIFYRIGITPAGQWRFFVAGD